MLRKNAVLSKEALLSQLYGGMDEPHVKIIDVFICKIRKKLAEAGATDIVRTVWGRGYTIRAEDGKLPVSQQPQTERPLHAALA